ncbi:MAG: hypothetical protein AAGC68_12185, partial [Verrucomicrobiota bacterium]
MNGIELLVMNNSDHSRFVPKRRHLIWAFLAGYAVFCGLNAWQHGINIRGALEGFVLYAPIVGGALLIPWVLLPVIENQPSRETRVVQAMLAGLLPVVLVIAILTALFLGWDASAFQKVSFILAISAWFLPMIGVLAYTAIRGADEPAPNPKRGYLIRVGSLCLVS